MLHIIGPGLSAVLISVLLFSGAPVNEPVGQLKENALNTGDYAVYSLGSCTPPHIALYTPFYGFEESDDPDAQVWGFAWACPVTLRWEVLLAGPDTAEIRIGMDGWFYRWNELENVEGIIIGSSQWFPGPEDPIRDEINATLHAIHTIEVDLATMDASAAGGMYLGRWPFHIPLADITAARTEIVRNWYGGTSVPANVSATTTLSLGADRVMQTYYDVDVFVEARTGPDVPFPVGLERYVHGVGGGWHTLNVVAALYDANTSLLLTTLNTLPDDLLFNLYGLVWIADSFRGPASPFWSTLALVETNILDVLLDVPVGGSVPPEPGGLPVQDDPPLGNGGEDPGDPDGTGQTGDSGGTGVEGRTGGGSTESPPPPDIPWTFIALAAILLLIIVIAYRDRRGGTGNERQSSRKPRRRGSLRTRHR